MTTEKPNSTISRFAPFAMCLIVLVGAGFTMDRRVTIVETKMSNYEKTVDEINKKLDKQSDKLDAIIQASGIRNQASEKIPQ